MTNVGISLSAPLADCTVQAGSLTAHQFMVIGNATAARRQGTCSFRSPPMGADPGCGQAEQSPRLGGGVRVVFRGQGDASDQGEQVGDGHARCQRAIVRGATHQWVTCLGELSRAAVLMRRVGAGLSG